jgi:GT2 family glycosyltransferase
MKLVVVIATFGRGVQVARLLAHLERQHHLPDEVILSAPDETHLVPLRAHSFKVSVVFGKTGLAAQRNSALTVALPRFDIITFFDDDFIPADDYLKLIIQAFAEDERRVVLMGRVVKDGAATAGLEWNEAMLALRKSETEKPPEPRVVNHVGAYGCNMSMRSSSIGDLRFDERLVLYGWQEDIDFTSQLRRKGLVVGLSWIRGVHLGLKAGRVSGRRFGYSQVANPVYLVRKGSVPASFALPLMARNIVANVLKCVRPEPFVDRRGRLHGNLHALFHVMRGRIEPEFILKL